MPHCGPGRGGQAGLTVVDPFETPPYGPESFTFHNANLTRRQPGIFLLLVGKECIYKIRFPDPVALGVGTFSGARLGRQSDKLRTVPSSILFIALFGAFLFPSLGLSAFTISMNMSATLITALFSSLAACGFGLFLGMACNFYEQASTLGATSVVAAAAIGGG